MFQLVSEDLTHLGGSMGTEYTTENYTKHFSTDDKAKKHAEKEYGSEIKWERKKEKKVSWCSGDLGYVMYHIKEITLDEE
jgi:hypothetical protein